MCVGVDAHGVGPMGKESGFRFDGTLQPKCAHLTQIWGLCRLAQTPCQGINSLLGCLIKP